jgi:dTDP-4-dehydrorhamnose 3,5-epimerase
MSGRFDIFGTPLAGLAVLQRKPMYDARGYLERLFCTAEFSSLLAGRGIAQINRTLTVRRGTVRGLHLQHPPHAEAKFVSCLRGAVFDVAVDLRRDSPTFLQWHAQVLSSDNHMTMMIPEGFAHGFQALAAHCELLYFHTAAFHPQAERGFNALDPRLGIDWPEAITEQSARDAAHPLLTAQFAGIET